MELFTRRLQELKKRSSVPHSKETKSQEASCSMRNLTVIGTTGVSTKKTDIFSADLSSFCKIRTNDKHLNIKLSTRF